MLDTYEHNSRVKLTAIILTVLVLAGLVVLIDYLKAQHAKSNLAQNNNNTSTSSGSSSDSGSLSVLPTTPTQSDNSSSSTDSNANYKDGTYNATSDYFVPHGQEEIKVNLTLKNGT